MMSAARRATCWRSWSRRGRFEQLPAVSREFRRLHLRREGIVEATVTTASGPGTADVEALRERLEIRCSSHGSGSERRE